MFGSRKFPSTVDTRFDDGAEDASEKSKDLENWIVAWTIAVKTWLWIIAIAIAAIAIIWIAFFATGGKLAWLP